MTKINVFMDGDKFCATYEDFVNLQESPAGFGDTREEAILSLGRIDTIEEMLREMPVRTNIEKKEGGYRVAQRTKEGDWIFASFESSCKRALLDIKKQMKEGKNITNN